MNGEIYPTCRKVNWWAVVGFLCMLFSSAVTVILLFKLFELVV